MHHGYESSTYSVNHWLEPLASLCIWPSTLYTIAPRSNPLLAAEQLAWQLTGQLAVHLAVPRTTSNSTNHRRPADRPAGRDVRTPLPIGYSGTSDGCATAS